jgi:hypothetical protein
VFENKKLFFGCDLACHDSIHVQYFTESQPIKPQSEIAIKTKTFLMQEILAGFELLTAAKLSSVF